MKAHQLDRVILAVVILLISANFNSLSSAVDGEDSRAVLGGLKSVYVHVDALHPEIKQKGIAAAQVRKDVEQQLMKAGIRVLSEEEYSRIKISATYPFARLELSITMEEIQIDENVSLNVFDIVVRVSQAVFLGRKPAIKMFAPTWERREMNFTNSVADVQQRLRAFVSEFIAAYLAANPR